MGTNGNRDGADRRHDSSERPGFGASQGPSYWTDQTETAPDPGAGEGAGGGVDDGEAPVLSLLDRARGSVLGDAALAVLADGPAGANDGELLADAQRLLAIQQVINAAVYRTVGVAISRGVHTLDGDLSPKAWISRIAQITSTDAYALARNATTARRHDPLFDGLADGTITPATIDAFSRADRAGRQDVFLAQLDVLREAAAKCEHPDDIAVLMRRWTAMADDCLGKGDPAAQHDARRFVLAETFAGMMTASGMLEPAEGAILAAALEDLIEPDPADCPEGPRTRAQLMADALVTLAEMYLRTNRFTGEGGPITGIEILADLDTIAALTHTDDDCPCDTNPNHDHDHDGGDCGDGGGDCGDGDGGFVEYPIFDPSRDIRRRHRRWLQSLTAEQLIKLTVDLRHVGPIHPATVAMLLCDCKLSRTIFDLDRNIASMTARTRTWTPAQRRAIEARDGHCTFGTCRCRADWCEIDHIIPVEHGGETSVANGRLLCRRHHRKRHLGWDLVPDPLAPPGSRSYYPVAPPTHERHAHHVTELNRRRRWAAEHPQAA